MSILASLVETPVATRQDVSRLFARAAFGATGQDLDTWAGQPYADVVEHLLDIPALDGRPAAADEPERLLLERAPEGAADPNRVLRMAGVSIGGGDDLRTEVEGAGNWWLERMRTTQYPLEERMTLLWHDHFATAYLAPYPDAAMLVRQNQTLRRHALGNFRTLIETMTLDPAMLYWLNGNENQKGKPNENYARELFELFTLGVIPQVYTEQDIREAARALTGWTVTGPLLDQATFSSGNHDTRPKTVLGVTFGNLGDQEYKKVIDIALAQQAAPKFVAYKMAINFAYVPSTGDLFQDPDPLVDKVAASLTSSGWNLKEAVRTLLMSDEFRYADPTAGRQIVRQPIDLVVSALKQIGVSANTVNPRVPLFGPPDQTPTVIEILRRMGQVPFDPPNVGGWPASKEWLSPVTTLARYDWGVTVYNLYARIALIFTNGPTPTAALNPLPASSNLDAWAERFGLAGLSANTTTLIQDYLQARAGVQESEKQAGVLILLASSPEWMVM